MAEAAASQALCAAATEAKESAMREPVSFMTTIQAWNDCGLVFLKVVEYVGMEC
jgi:hypothetical protein